MLTDPFHFQLQAARQMHRFGGRMLLADEPGLGKSASALLYGHQRGLFPLLVVCPKTLKWNWAKEADRHFGTQSLVLEGSAPNRTMEEAKAYPITVINYDTVISARGRGKGWLSWLLEVGYQYLVLDEGHYLCGQKTKRTRAATALCEAIGKVMVLTGTPFTSRPAGLWPILHMLRPDLWPSFRPFADRHCDPKRNRYSNQMEYKGAKRMDELHNKLVSTVMLRRTKSEVLSELPSCTRCVLPLPITNEKEYRTAETNFLEWLRTSEWKGRERAAARAEALVKVNYLKQLAARLKYPAVIEWMNNFFQSGKKLVVFCTHKRMVDDIFSRWRSQAVRIEGDTTSRQRQQAVDRFQTEDQCRLLVGNLKAAGTGITLTAASDVAFVEFGWTPGEHLQAEKRCDRISQTEPVTAWWLVAHDTIENRLVSLIQDRQEAFAAAIDGGKGDNPLDVFDQLCEVLG